MASNFTFLFLPLLLLFPLRMQHCESDLMLNYYSNSCPEAEEIVKEEAKKLYEKEANIAISWVRVLFHDCMVESCDASLLLASNHGIVSEMNASRSQGMRYLLTLNQIKKVLEAKCPSTVSCADVIALAAREAVVLLGGPNTEMRTGRRDSLESYTSLVDTDIPNHNDSMDSVLCQFQCIGIDAQRTAAILGAHSVGRTHCVNIYPRLYPTMDPSLDPKFGEYLLRRCPDPATDTKKVRYAKNDLTTPTVLDNNYYKNVLAGKGVLLVDEELRTHPSTAKFVEAMASNNSYFLEQFGEAFLLLSENNPLTGDQGEIRKDCRYVNNHLAPT